MWGAATSKRESGLPSWRYGCHDVINRYVAGNELRAYKCSNCIVALWYRQEITTDLEARKRCIAVGGMKAAAFIWRQEEQLVCR